MIERGTDAMPASAAYARTRPASFEAMERTSHYITMRDGVKIAVDAYRPLGAPEKLPTLVRQTRYFRALEPTRLGRWLGDSRIDPVNGRMRRFFVSRGYAWVDVDVRGELAKPRKAGQKSWKAGGLLSLCFGPLGWLYAGSFRETIPAAAAWLAIAAVLKTLSFLAFLFLPALAVIMPLSGIVGILYTTGYNKHGKRVKLFTKDKPKPKAVEGQKPRALPSGR